MKLSPTHIALLAGVVAAAALALYLIGHPLICKCGYVKLWHFDIESAENSQHLVDWYTPSHIIHGFLFYWLLWLAAVIVIALEVFIGAMIRDNLTLNVLMFLWPLDSVLQWQQGR